MCEGADFEGLIQLSHFIALSLHHSQEYSEHYLLTCRGLRLSEANSEILSCPIRGRRILGPKFLFLEEKQGGTSLVVQWLRICFPMQETWLRFLVGELRFHMPQGNNNSCVPQLERSLQLQWGSLVPPLRPSSAKNMQIGIKKEKQDTEYHNHKNFITETKVARVPPSFPSCHNFSSIAGSFSPTEWSQSTWILNPHHDFSPAPVYQTLSSSLPLSPDVPTPLPQPAPSLPPPKAEDCSSLLILSPNLTNPWLILREEGQEKIG